MNIFIILILFFISLYEINFLKNFIDYNICFSNKTIWTFLFYLNNNNNSLFMFFLFFLCFFNYFSKNTFFYLYLFLHFIVNSVYININYAELLSTRLNNIPLSNGVLLIHPFFIYMTYFYLFTFIHFNMQVLTKNNLYLTISAISYIAIFLGSFWAQQELNWGGWWNWDFVELIALIFFLFPVIFIHRKKENLMFNIYKNNLYFYFFLFFIIVRCDILSSIHSFNSFSFLEKYLYYVYVFFVFLVLFFLFFKKMVFFKNHFLKKQKKMNLIYYLFTLMMSVVVWYVLYNIVLFYIFNQQNVNSFFFIKLFFYLLISYTLLSIFDKKINLFFLISLTYNFYLFLIFIYFYILRFFKKNTIFLIHLLIVCFIILIESYSYILMQFQISSLNTVTNFEQDFITFRKKEYLDNFVLFLESYFVINMSNFLTSGFLESLLVNNIFIKVYSFIQYDLIDNFIFLFYKNICTTFLIALSFSVILIFRILRIEYYQVV